MWFPKDQVRSFLKGNSNVYKFILEGMNKTENLLW